MKSLTLHNFFLMQMIFRFEFSLTLLIPCLPSILHIVILSILFLFCLHLFPSMVISYSEKQNFHQQLNTLVLLTIIIYSLRSGNSCVKKYEYFEFGENRSFMMLSVSPNILLCDKIEESAVTISVLTIYI